MPGKLDWSSGGFQIKKKKGKRETNPACFLSSSISPQTLTHLQELEEVSDEPVVGNSSYFTF